MLQPDHGIIYRRDEFGGIDEPVLLGMVLVYELFYYLDVSNYFSLSHVLVIRFSVICVPYYSAQSCHFVVTVCIAVRLFLLPSWPGRIEKEILISVSLFTGLNNEYWFISALPARRPSREPTNR